MQPQSDRKISRLPGHAHLVSNCSARLGESILWHPVRGTLIWADLLDPRLFELNIKRDALTVIPLDAPPPLGTIATTQSPDHLILAHRGGVSVLNLLSKEIAPWLVIETDREQIGLNDGKVDRSGRLWIGSHDLDEQEPRGVLWRLRVDGSIALADAGFIVSNGPAFSPDGSTLYFNDSCARRTLSYQVGANAKLMERRTLATYDESEGLPDGLTVDADGDLWIAHWGGSRVTRLSPRGERKTVVLVPTPNVTSVCFGGHDYRTLYITTAKDGATADDALAGSVFAFKPGTAGLPETPFALPELAS